MPYVSGEEPSIRETDPTLSPDLVDRVLLKLGLSAPPSLDLAGLNTLYAAFCGSVPGDNVQKRIWFAGDQTSSLPGGEPREFLGNWLAHGTGGTCFPINGAMCALAQALGFNARRIAGSMLVEDYTHDDNHGSVIVTLEEVDYLVDAQIAAFRVLPLVPGTPSTTGERLHDISAVPIDGGGFDVLWYSGVSREEPKTFRTRPQYDPVDHNFFLHTYDRTRKKGRDLFNHALYACCRFPDSIVTLGRRNKITVGSDNSLTKIEITNEDRKRVLIEEFRLTEEIVEALPPDVPGEVALL